MPEKSMHELRNIISRLRAPDGCPWDREQTPKSLKKYLIEEIYELVDAIEKEDNEEISEEIGDIFFMLLFVAHIFEEKSIFYLKDALTKSEIKMKRRHPHIFGDANFKNSEEVWKNWRETKIKEAKEKGETPTVLGNIPRSLPALQRAFRIGERAGRIGFDWKKADDIWDKIKEEENELKKEIAEKNNNKIMEELGDLLFSICNLSRHLKINPEEALNLTTDKFISRFKKMEVIISEKNLDINNMTIQELDEIWEKVKEL